MHGDLESERWLRVYQKVSAIIAADPACVPVVLRAVTDAFAAFVAAEKERRDSLADASVRALMGMVDCKSPGAGLVGLLIEPAYHQFPNGLAGHSPVESRFWEHFIGVAAEDGIDKEWVRRTRGEDCLRWVVDHVEPAVEAMRAGKPDG